MRTLHAIVAINNTGTIGDKDTLPWHDMHDLEYFYDFIEYKELIVGGKTYKNLPDKVKRMPNVKFIVISDSVKYNDIGFNDELVRSWEVQSVPEDYPDAVVIGGKQIYELFSPFIKFWHVSRIDDDVHGDTKLNIKDLMKL